MVGSQPFESDDEERVIDRTGDIDQRPPEERGAFERPTVPAVVGSRAPTESPVQHFGYSPAPQGARSHPSRVDLSALARSLQRDIDKKYLKAKGQLEALAQKIEVQEKRVVTPKLDDDLQQLRFQRQKLLIANGPMLADHLREEKSRLADLEQFKKANRLTRDAHYPSSPLFAFGVLLLLILVEAGINGVLFAETSDQGLFGGWLEAFVLSATNVCAAFLFGRLVLPQLHRRGLLVKPLAGLAALAGFGLLIAINLGGAHYRDFKGELAKHETEAPTVQPKSQITVLSPSSKTAVPGQSAKTPIGTAASPSPLPPSEPGPSAVEQDAIRQALANPLALRSFSSLFLLAIGLCGATIAAWDGYKFDDPFPGFGKRHRRYCVARERTAEALRKILGQSNTIMAGTFQTISRRVETYAQDVQSLLALHHAYLADYRSLKTSLDEAVSEADAEIAAHDRLANKLPARDVQELNAISVKTLPELSEKHVKFYETHDKRLKALQKSTQKEQNDVLGLFEEASAGFQKLLAEASHTSLRISYTATAEEPDA
jgi:hypothetical protein